VVAGVVDRALLCDAHPVLDLAKICSIRLMSGEYGGRYHSFAPAFWIICRTVDDLWLPRLSMTTMSPGLSTLTSCYST
jgi:hypothetical protein